MGCPLGRFSSFLAYWEIKNFKDSLSTGFELKLYLVAGEEMDEGHGNEEQGKDT